MWAGGPSAARRCACCLGHADRGRWPASSPAQFMPCLANEHNRARLPMKPSLLTLPGLLLGWKRVNRPGELGDEPRSLGLDGDRGGEWSDGGGRDSRDSRGTSRLFLLGGDRDTSSTSYGSGPSECGCRQVKDGRVRTKMASKRVRRSSELDCC